ncbi:MAG: TatD family hydrolase [Candidatus Paceibacterota bacterium]
MEFNYFDIHSHLNFPDFDKDREDVIKKMIDEKIGTICVGADLKTSKECVELANKHENIWATIGVHPNDNKEDFDEENFQELLRGSTSNEGLSLSKVSKVVGIGECGLDYFRIKGEPENEKKRQKNLFEKQIQFAINNDLPLMIHSRDAYDDILDILNSYKKENPNLKGNIHFFVGDKNIAKKFFDIDFAISFSGVITFTNDYNETIEYAPIEKIMPDSDSPFVAPAPFRGKRNEPIYIKEIVKKIAEIKKLDIEVTKKQMVRNAVNTFKLTI